MKVCPSAKADDGELAVTVLGEVPTRTFLRVFPRVFSGSHVSHPSVKTYTGTTVRVDAPGMVAYADGERLGPVPVEVSLLPGAIRVLGE
jgi:diacylglycerol kinase (ATP)